MSHVQKQRIYEQFARIGKAVASPARLELLDLLAQAERSVEDLAARAQLTVANASQHLRGLHAARLVDVRRDGKHMIYRLASAEVAPLLVSLRRVAEAQLADLDRVAEDYLKGRNAFEPIDRHELHRRMAAGEVLLIDVRPREEFDACHIAGALSVTDVEAFARNVPAGMAVVAYCRGPYCVYALEAAGRLRALGIAAGRLEDGVAEWRMAGLPVEPDRWLQASTP